MDSQGRGRLVSPIISRSLKEQAPHPFLLATNHVCLSYRQTTESRTCELGLAARKLTALSQYADTTVSVRTSAPSVDELHSAENMAKWRGWPEYVVALEIWPLLSPVSFTD